jgi:hypothetical protein
MMLQNRRDDAPARGREMRMKLWRATIRLAASARPRTCRLALALLVAGAGVPALAATSEAFADWQDIARAGGPQVDALSLAPQSDGKLVYRWRRGPGHLHLPRWVVADCTQGLRGEPASAIGADAGARPTTRVIEAAALRSVSATSLEATELDWACARAGLAAGRTAAAAAPASDPAPATLESLTTLVRRDLAESRQVLGMAEAPAPTAEASRRAAAFAGDERMRTVLAEFLAWVVQRRQQAEKALAPLEARLGDKVLDDHLAHEHMMSRDGRAAAYLWIDHYGALAHTGTVEAERMLADMRAELARRAAREMADPLAAQRVAERVGANLDQRAAFLIRFWSAGQAVAQAGREYVDFFEHYRGDVELRGSKLVFDTDANLGAFRAVATRLDRAQAELREALGEVAQRQSDSLATLESLSSPSR